MARAVTPIVAIVLLVGVTVVGAAGVASVATGLDERVQPAATPTFAVSAEAATQSITLAHRGGDAVDLRDVSMRITVEGEPLAHQPPVPYFAAEGFQGTPTGPLNAGGDPTFDPGERGTLQLAATNAPQFAAGDRVRVTIRRDGNHVARAQVVAS